VLDAAFEENDPVKCQPEKQAMLVDPHPVATSSSTSFLEVEPSTDVGHADAQPFPQLPETPKTTQITAAPISNPTRREFQNSATRGEGGVVGRPKKLVHTRAKSIQCELVPLPPLTLLRPFGESTVKEHIVAEETEFPMVKEEESDCDSSDDRDMTGEPDSVDPEWFPPEDIEEEDDYM
ncbi:hypothetical protein KUCAC02_023414, partial [Chaenocephalus aceratus]